MKLSILDDKVKGIIFCCDAMSEGIQIQAIRIDGGQVYLGRKVIGWCPWCGERVVRGRADIAER